MSLQPRLRRTRFAPVFAAALLISAGTALAQDAAVKMPDGKTVLERAHEASGGKAMAKHQNRVQKGTFSVPAQQLTGSFTTYSAPPNLFLNVIEMSMIGKMQQGYDGKVAWSNDAMQGPRILSDEELESMLVEANFDSDLTDVFPEATTVGDGSFGGHDCWKVSMKTSTGNESIGWFDKDSGLMRGMERTMKSPMGELPVKVILGDYAEAHGMKYPMKTTMEMAGMQQVMTVDEVLVNVADMPSFSPPAEVAALRKTGE